MLNDYGIKIHMSGGETADVGDIVRTIDVGYTTFARAHKNDLIVNDMKDGDVIVGIAGYGQSTYEDHYNGGMGSNGLTSARHDVFKKEYYKKYPDSFDHHSPEELIYAGKRSLTDKVDIEGREIAVSYTHLTLPTICSV